MSSDQLKKQLLAQKLLRSVKDRQKSAKSSTSNKKQANSKESVSSTDKNNCSEVKVNEADLTRRAIEEIQRDTMRAASLADEIGPSGWRLQTKRTNKRFLSNTMKSVLSHNERTSLKHATESQRKFQELTKRPPKFGARLHSFQLSDERSTKKEKQTNPNT